MEHDRIPTTDEEAQKAIEVLTKYFQERQGARQKQQYVITDPESPATAAQYRKMFAVWHHELKEDPNLKPTKGMTKGQASTWITEHEGQP